MKILFIAGLDPYLSQGHASHVRHLVDELIARGHAVSVLARNDGGQNTWPTSARVLRLARVPLPTLGQIGLEMQTIRTLRRWIREDRPDVVLARSEFLAFAALFVPAGIPFAIESNSSQIRHAAESRRGIRHRIRSYFAARLENALFRRADRIGVVAPSLLKIHQQYHDTPVDSFFVVRNGTSLPPLLAPDETRALRQEHAVPETDFLLALSGSASMRIEFTWLIRALESTSGARLWVMGQGELWQSWQDAARSSSAADRIQFLGAFSEKDEARHLQAAQVVLAPYAEGCIQALGGDPLKVLTGMASGRPLLASGLPTDPPFDALGAGRRIEGSAASWAEAVQSWCSEWDSAGRPLTEWPWHDEGPGRPWIRENRTWARAAETWESELLPLV